MSSHSWPHVVRIIVFACLLGGAAGVIGTALTASYLSDYALELSELTEPLRITQERPRALPKDYEDVLNELEDQALPAMGSLFSQSVVGETGVSVFEGEASVIALTSDGWALTSQGRVGDMVHWNSQTCEVDEVVEEPMFGYVFIHCATSNVPVIDVTTGFDVSAGDQLFVISSGHDLVATQARAVVWGDVSRSSDTPSRRIVITDELSSGGAVFNVYGELIGVLGENSNEVIPFEFLSGAFEQVLASDGEITYPSLGVNGIDLTHAVGVSDDISLGLHSGWVLYGSRAVEYNSAAYEVGLLSGDIIISVEGVTVNGTYSLDDLIATYSAGDEVRIEIERNGNRQEVTVTLGEQDL